MEKISSDSEIVCYFTLLTSLKNNITKIKNRMLPKRPEAYIIITPNKPRTFNVSLRFNIHTSPTTTEDSKNKPKSSSNTSPSAQYFFIDSFVASDHALGRSLMSVNIWTQENRSKEIAPKTPEPHPFPFGTKSPTLFPRPSTTGILSIF